MFGKFFAGSILAALLFISINHSHAAAPLGVNLSSVNDWSTEWPFVDIFKTSRKWISQDLSYGGAWNSGETIVTDAQGWPTQLPPNRSAGTLVATDAGMPAGDYTVFYEGSGTLNISVGPGVSIKSRSPGKIVLAVQQNTRIHLHIDKTPIRNIRVMMPGFENSASNTFHPLFLDRLKPYKVLRFMDWGNTNNSKVVNWSDRTLPTNSTQATAAGASIETMIQLCNTARKDMWVNIPHKATDDYVLQLAKLVKQNLDPTLKVHIEYSNEVWNGMFEQYGYAQQLGLSQNLSTNPYQANLRFYSQRAVKIFSIWSQVFGTSASTRMVRVMATQMIPWSVNEISSWKDAYKSADAIAIAPYFGYHYSSSAERTATLALTPSQLAAKLPQDIQQTMTTVAAIKQVANKFGLRLIAYESGQHLVDFGSPYQNQLTTLFSATNRLPQMKSVYANYFMNWESINNDLMMVFSSVGRCSKWGCWGVLETQDQLKGLAPKFQSIIDYTKVNTSY